MRLSGWMVAAALLALIAAAPALADEPADAAKATYYEITLTGDIEIGPDGNIHSYQIDEGQPAVIEKALKRNIETWRFEPVTIDGRPVIAASSMSVQLSARPIADTGNFRLMVENVQFGAPKRHFDNMDDMEPPRYPSRARRVGLGATVILVLKLDAAGKVTRVHAERVSLTHRTRGEETAKRWREVFADASRRAAERWSFTIAERVDGEPVGTSVRVPVIYEMDYGPSSDNDWQAYVPGPYHPIPWVTASAVADVPSDGLEQGELQPLQSRFKLKTDVVGSVL